MAIYEVTYQFIDEQGRSTDRLLLVDEPDEAALLTAAAAMATVLNDLSQCGIQQYDYRRRVSVGDTPGAGSNIDPGATFSWVTTLNIDPTSQIPNPIDAAKDGQGNIDLTNAQVVAYTSAFISGNWRLNRNVPTQPSAVKKATLDK